MVKQEEDFKDEIIVFFEILKMNRHQVKSVGENIEVYYCKKILTVAFPSVKIAFWIYLSILGISCEGESSFLTMKRVINYSRSTRLVKKS